MNKKREETSVPSLQAFISPPTRASQIPYSLSDTPASPDTWQGAIIDTGPPAPSPNESNTKSSNPYPAPGPLTK